MSGQVYDISPAEGGVLAPAGFAAAGVAAGIKKRPGARDVCVLDAGTPVPSAAVFTVNTMAAPPVEVSRAALADGLLRAWVINAGNANACTGEPGLADARAMAARAAAAFGCDPSDVGVASTGVIGVPLPMDRALAGIEDAAGALGTSAEHDTAAAEAIMTTDTFVKQAAFAIEVDTTVYTVGGMAKGSGMIEPNMATMLAFVTTDAPLTPGACSALLGTAVASTFNRITVDGDTSTNDTCALMASGAAGGESIGPGHPHLPAIAAAITRTCAELARMIVRDGEGATKLVEVTVCGAASEQDAEAAAREIANSPLFKTALFGRDANWGRVAMALGNSGVAVDPSRVEIVFAGITTCEGGTAVAFSEEEAAKALARDELEVRVDLHLGPAEATVLTCDLTYEYVRINGEYRT
ncbi:MAG: bifunctional glutamate N-acetyltransferase/amino-acid acetyltransferase ArgJ [Coriobacteriia bacterium]|nr:bifunctional glutamate N-acetyltransferase/amino-acid acetyltransferase ArgJ [Coriobacteriia bacterium]